mmetsp:Transcript_82660/g.207994  ORF Transcript_82660/g.207994 Transcript_82660/m.207994 type:complete len:208 (-) Transcript_82660:497-1120(-)
MEVAASSIFPNRFALILPESDPKAAMELQRPGVDLCPPEALEARSSRGDRPMQVAAPVAGTRGVGLGSSTRRVRLPPPTPQAGRTKRCREPPRALRPDSSRLLGHLAVCGLPAITLAPPTPSPSPLRWSLGGDSARSTVSGGSGPRGVSEAREAICRGDDSCNQHAATSTPLARNGDRGSGALLCRTTAGTMAPPLLPTQVLLPRSR